VSQRTEDSRCGDAFWRASRPCSASRLYMRASTHKRSQHEQQQNIMSCRSFNTEFKSPGKTRHSSNVPPGTFSIYTHHGCRERQTKNTANVFVPLHNVSYRYQLFHRPALIGDYIYSEIECKNQKKKRKPTKHTSSLTVCTASSANAHICADHRALLCVRM
jgi:hypothetical protein